MPWQDNSGNRGPWGQPPRGGNDGNRNNGGRGQGEPPDLEDLLEASRQRLRRAFPRGRGGDGRGSGGFEFNGRTGGLVAAALVALWGFSGFYQVDAGELGVVTTFGKYSNVTSPGLNWHVPAPIQSVSIRNVEDYQRLPIPAVQRRGDASEGLMLTGDKNIVDVAIQVVYKVKSDLAAQEGDSLPGVAQYVFNIDDPTNLVQTVGEAAIREVVGHNELDYVQTDGRTIVQEETRALMQEALDLYKAGIQVVEVNLEKTEPPTDEVNQAFLDVEAAKQDRERSINQARAEANKIVPEARGRAQQTLEASRAYAARVTADARGQADRFNKVREEYEKAPDVTRQRMYLETVEDVLGDMNKIIVEDDAGTGVVPYLPLTEINRKKGDQ